VDWNLTLVLLCGTYLQVAAEHAAAMNALQEQLQQSQKSSKRLAERGKAAAVAASAAAQQKLELEQQLDGARCGQLAMHTSAHFGSCTMHSCSVRSMEQSLTCLMDSLCNCLWGIMHSCHESVSDP
jgi:hypothetical protein